MKLRLVCLSDLHDKKINIPIPHGDVLVVAGDICKRGSLQEIDRFDRFLADLPHPYKLVVAGNHDWPFARVPVDRAGSLLTHGLYLQDSAIEINGVKFWGAPWQRRYFDGAFDLNQRQELVDKWNKIPCDTDVLITHTPPYGILDRTRRGKHIGCKELAKAIQLIKPKIHIFGHVHESAGMIYDVDSIFVNASLSFASKNKKDFPIIVEIDCRYTN